MGMRACGVGVWLVRSCVRYGVVGCGSEDMVGVVERCGVVWACW